MCFQLELQKALLNVGEFQSAIDQLMLWISQTLSSLDQPSPVYGDPKTIDAELSRLKVHIFATCETSVSLSVCVSVFILCEHCMCPRIATVDLLHFYRLNVVQDSKTWVYYFMFLLCCNIFRFNDACLLLLY